jgi:hypothetical protein
MKKYAFFLGAMYSYNIKRGGQARIYRSFLYDRGCAVAHLVEALRYKLDSRGIDSRWYLWILFRDILPAALWP